MLAVRAPALLADLRTYFLNASALSERPMLLAPGQAAARGRAACRARPAAPDRSSSEDSASGQRLDTEDEPGTPPPPAPRLCLAQVLRLTWHTSTLPLSYFAVRRLTKVIRT